MKQERFLESGSANGRALDPARLNIETRSRISRLPWRGQFSPELIEYLMDALCSDSRIFLDPFCGSGTVLYEAIARGCTALGQEVNPAAWHLAVLATFPSVSREEKAYVTRHVRSLMAISGSADLFNRDRDPKAVLELINSPEASPMLRRALAAIVLLGMGDERELTHTAISRGGETVMGVLSELFDHDVGSDCHLADARRILLAAESVDAVITSPPYINVFNYHQNYRPAAELLGWKPLEAAPSEIGANRKHRMNRFLTVIQYCLDMSQCLDEVGRVMRTGAPLVIVLGRTSNVLGASFENGTLIKHLLPLSGAFSSIVSAERVFTNPYGARIYEDILIGHRERVGTTNIDDARNVGTLALTAARATVPAKNREALDEAIAAASDVRPSPILNVSIPTAFFDEQARYTNASRSIDGSRR